MAETQGTIPWLFNKLFKDEITNLSLLNEDGWRMVDYMKNNDSISNFKITYNYTKGKTLFEKLKP